MSWVTQSEVEEMREVEEMGTTIKRMADKAMACAKEIFPHLGNPCLEEFCSGPPEAMPGCFAVTVSFLTTRRVDVAMKVFNLDAKTGELKGIKIR